MSDYTPVTITHKPIRERIADNRRKAIEGFLDHFQSKPRVRLHVDGSAEMYAVGKNGYVLRLDIP